MSLETTLLQDLQNTDYDDFLAAYFREQRTRLHAALKALRFQMSKSVLFTEDATSVTHTGTLTIPAGSLLQDILVWSTVLWTDSSAALIVGDANDNDGFFISTNLAATDLLVGERLQASNANNWGGKNGAYLTTAGRFGQASGNNIGGYMPTEYDITGVVSVSTPSGSAGRTYMTALYTHVGATAATVA